MIIELRKSEGNMDKKVDEDQVASNVLLHLYYSVVIGTLNSVAIALRMSLPDESMNPRHKDLKRLYDALAPEQGRLFYDGITAN